MGSSALVYLEYKYIPVIQLDVRISDWVILKPHEVEVEHWGELHKHYSFLSLLCISKLKLLTKGSGNNFSKD